MAVSADTKIPRNTAATRAVADKEKGWMIAVGILDMEFIHVPPSPGAEAFRRSGIYAVSQAFNGL